MAAFIRKTYKNTFIDEYKDWSLSSFSIFSMLNNSFKNKSVQYVADVGNNQMWAAHTLKLGKGQAMHHSGGLGAMGFAIPTAVGLYYESKAPVVVITGDGGAQLNIQELDIIAREGLPVLILLFNNYSLGMVKGFQDLYFDGRNASTYWNGFSADFTKIGIAYGIDSIKVKDIEGLKLGVNKFITARNKPLLIEIIMPDARECRPRLEFGCSIDEQTPSVSWNAKV